MEQEKLRKKLEKIKVLLDECLITFGSSEQCSQIDSKKKPVKTKLPKDMISSVNIEFNLPMRPFIAKYAKNISGPKKFVILLAYLTKGDQKKEIELKEIEKNWNKMTAGHLLGMKFNRYFSSQAKDKGWVDSKKTGQYNLRSDWKEVFE